MELPAILAKLDYLDGQPLADPRLDGLRLNIAAKCWALHCRLTAWFVENSHKVYMPDTEAPVPFDFPNLSVATLSIRYWATATILYQSLDRALRYSAYESIPPYLDRPHGRPFAHLIVRSVSGLFKRDHGIAGPSAVLFPLGIALMYLRQSDLPDTDYLNLVFAVWDDPDWPRSIKNFLRSMSRAINLPSKVLSENPVTWSTSELKPMYDADGNVLSGPYLKPSRFLCE